MELNQNEALRYLGYKGKPDNALQSALDTCKKELEKTAVPKSVHRILPLSFPTAETIGLSGISIHSNDLAQHLSGCKEAILFAATLGAPVDLLLQRYSRLDMSYAVILQACAAALTEAYCDECEKPLAKDAASRGLFLRPRYSPGYGDFAISHQKDMLAILDCPRKIGLTITESFMLAPTKSVTAIIGLTPQEQSCHIAKCMNCKSKNCPFRKV